MSHVLYMDIKRLPQSGSIVAHQVFNSPAATPTRPKTAQARGGEPISHSYSSDPEPAAPVAVHFTPKKRNINYAKKIMKDSYIFEV